MKLLFDNNLSHKLVARLVDLFPGSSHVMSEGLDESEDHEIWKFARVNEFTIVTKDSDFNDLSIIRGNLPKGIWLRVGNCKVSEIEEKIRENLIAINEFSNDPDLGILEID
jgi:predicted nuclease of predicted toxin-antitoxin system